LDRIGLKIHPFSLMFLLITFTLFHGNCRKKCKTAIERADRIQRQRHDQWRQSKQMSLERCVKAVDRQIDALVYELYALTEEEIEIVEGVS